MIVFTTTASQTLTIIPREYLGSFYVQFRDTSLNKTFSYFEDYDKYGRIETAPKYKDVLIDDENTVGNFTDSSGVVKNVAMWVNTNKEKDI